MSRVISPTAAQEQENFAHEFDLPALDESTVASLLFPDEDSTPSACTSVTGDAYARCLIAQRYAFEPDAHRDAAALFERARVVPGIEPSRIMDDGDYRGRITIEPAPPSVHSKHLSTLQQVFDGFQLFFERLTPFARAPVRFSFRGVGLKFYRTVNGRTPSAYAESGVLIGYNVDGELFDSVEGIRDTLFHELFHLNDTAHGDWSTRELSPIYAQIVELCHEDEACLDAHAPYDTKVDGGVYYAFHPTSSVREYGAELAIRYLREHLSVFAGERVARPFKCESARNRIAWQRLKDEFFGGVDRVGDCPTPRR